MRVYSPDFEEHGFGSPHTVVDIVTDDMPFVVDSVTTEVIRHGLGLHLTVHPVVAVRRDEGGSSTSSIRTIRRRGRRPSRSSTSRSTGRPTPRCWTN